MSGKQSGVRNLLMEVVGNRRAVLGGCKGIAAYTEECVKLRFAGGIVAIYGRQLELGCMTAEGVAVSGYLQRIEFEE